MLDLFNNVEASSTALNQYLILMNLFEKNFPGKATLLESMLSKAGVNYSACNILDFIFKNPGKNSALIDLIIKGKKPSICWVLVNIVSTFLDRKPKPEPEQLWYDEPYKLACKPVWPD